MGIKYEKNEQTFLFLEELKEEGHLQWLEKNKKIQPTCKVPDCLHNLYQLPSREGLMQESSLTAAGDGNGATDKVVLFNKPIRLGFSLMAELR